MQFNKTILITTLCFILLGCQHAVISMQGFSGGLEGHGDMDYAKGSGVSRDMIIEALRECSNKYKYSLAVNMCLYEKGYKRKTHPDHPCIANAKDDVCVEWLKTGVIPTKIEYEYDYKTDGPKKIE